MTFTIYLCAFFGITAAAFSNLLVSPRILMKYAQDGLFFKVFKEVDPITKIPTKGGWYICVVVCIVCFFFNLEAITKGVSVANLVSYSIVNISLVSYRFRPSSD